MSFNRSTVRDKLRDYASKNTFLQEEEFYDDEIDDAMSQSLSFWNSGQPELDFLEYSTTEDIPNRYAEWFCKGTIGILLQDHSSYLIRNRQPVQSEGVSTDINVRADSYKKIGDQYVQQFIEWIFRTKRALTSQGILTAEPGYAIPVLHFTEGTEQTVNFDVYNRDGEVLDYSSYDTITFIMKEYKTQSEPLLEKDVSISGGELQISIAEDDLTYSGVMSGEIIFSADSAVKNRYPAYINIEPSLSSSDSREILTIYTLREFLRDYADENVLYEQVEFSDSILADAIISTVNYWNSAPPHISKYTYTPATFPEEHIVNWREGAAGYALRTLANRLLRNMIMASEADVNNIPQKAEMYQKLSESYIKEYQQWVQNQKRCLNLKSAWGSKGLRSF